MFPLLGIPLWFWLQREKHSLILCCRAGLVRHTHRMQKGWYTHNSNLLQQKATDWRLAKGRSTWEEAQKKPGGSSWVCSPRRVTGSASFSQQRCVTAHAKCRQSGKLTWALASSFLGGVGHIDLEHPWLTSTTQTLAQRAKISTHHKSHCFHKQSYQTGTVGPKATGIQKQSHELEYSKCSELISQELTSPKDKPLGGDAQGLSRPGLLS